MRDVMTFVISALMTVSSEPIMIWCMWCGPTRRKWSSQKVAANHKSIPLGTVKHWQTICSSDLMLPMTKMLLFIRPAAACQPHTARADISMLIFSQRKKPIRCADSLFMIV